MERWMLMAAGLLLVLAACGGPEDEARRAVERAADRYEAMAEAAREAARDASGEARRRAEEARSDAEQAWREAEQQRRRLERNQRERIEEAWDRARAARDEAFEAWEDAFPEDRRPLEEAVEELGEQMRRLGEQVAGVVEDLGDGVEPVDWRKLRDLLPDRIDGLRQVDVEGERAGALGIRVASVEAVYEGGGRRLKVTIVDLGTLRGIARAGIDWLDVQIDREGADGFEYTRPYRGYPAHQKLERRHGPDRFEAEVIVADRFVVSYELTGEDLDDDVLEDVLEAVDYDDLEALHRAARHD